MTLGIVADLEFLVAGVLPLGGKADKKIGSGFQPALFEYDLHHIVGGAGIGRRFENDQLPAAEMARNDACGIPDERKVRITVSGQRRRHADDDDVALFEFGELRRGVKPAVGELRGKRIRRHGFDVGPSGVQRDDFFRVDVEAGYRESCAGDRHGQRQSDIAKADNPSPGLARRDLFQEAFIGRLKGVQAYDLPGWLRLISVAANWLGWAEPDGGIFRKPVFSKVDASC